jgi:hypothetical protein
VAGGGTGDSTIYLAHQLKERDAEVVHLDFSKSSMEIAQRRAAIRRLKNIRWVNGSILDVPRLNLGSFDYITCLGVLHHLPNPDDGLACLASVLSDCGAMALMLYGKYGRVHTYQMQEILRLINANEPDPTNRITHAKLILKNLPPTNLFRRTEGDQAIQQEYLTNDPILFDDLLTAQDRPYTVSEIYAYLETQGLRLVQFTSYQGIRPTCRLQYDPKLYIQDASLLARINRLSIDVRQHIAEMIDGSLSLHTLYASWNANPIASFREGNNIPSFLTSHGREASTFLASSPNAALPVVLRNGLTVYYNPGKLAREFIARIDGQMSIDHILDSISANSSLVSDVGDRKAALETVANDFDFLTALNWVVLRDRAGPPARPIRLQAPFKVPCIYEEPVLAENSDENGP